MSVPFTEKKAKIALLENDEGVVLHFQEEYDRVFMSPLRTSRQFERWNDAINYLKMWSTLSYTKWW